MEIVRTVADLRSVVATHRSMGKRIAVVPTMGGLHDGHLSLLKVALAQADFVITTLFVNPTQFSADEDLDSYPRAEQRDAGLLAAEGCGLLFCPTVEEMYPQNFSTRVIVDGVTDCLCGSARSGHFDGVAQVVTKLLNQAAADIAVFGEKDWQQIAVVRRLARDLDIPTRIVGAPTIREPDDLAMSSRNAYLTAEQRDIAAHLPKTMSAAISSICDGADIAQSCAIACDRLLSVGFDTVDYVEVRDGETLVKLEALEPNAQTRLFAAAHIGRTRLIDNMPVEIAVP